VRRTGSLALIAVALALAMPATSAGAVGDVQGFIVPPGTHAVSIDCAGDLPLEDLRFVFAGSPELRIIRIQGNQGGPDITFDDASPHDATVFFARNPIASSQSASFSIIVHNPLDRSLRLTFGVFCD